MADTYWGITLVASDGQLNSRVTAAAAQQGVEDPNYWAATHQWQYAAQPTWAEKYESALAASVPEPGKDSAVISDADILAAVQAIQAGSA